MITVDSVDSKIREVFASVLKIDGASLEERTHLVDDLSVDSLDALELAMRIQDSFSIELDERHFAQFTSYGEILACVRGALAGQASA